MESNNLSTGIELILSKKVKENDTASAYASGSLEVLATPAMIAFMEHTCWQLAEPYLESGHDTVGNHVDIKHLKATKVGKTITCTARLIDKQGPKLKFSVEVHDEDGKIGTGIHKRYIVERSSFINNLK